MTVAVPDNSSVAQWDASQGTGLEDFNPSDASIPRLIIEHVDGVFKDSTTEEEFQQIDCILLGLVKQRLMWPAEQGEGDTKDSPLCKSPDFNLGFPLLDEEKKLSEEKRFPWNASNFEPANLLAPEGTSEKALPCATCRFKEWNTDPKGNKPWCSEEWTVPLLYWANDMWNPAIIGFHRSGLKAAKKYIGAFANRKLPLFTAITTLGLDQQKRGNVRYCLPVFTRKGESDATEWLDYRQDFLGIQEYLKAFPANRDDSASTATENIEDNAWTGETVEAEVATPAAPTPPAAPAQPAAPAAPAAPTPPAQPAAPVAQPAPAAPTPPAAPVATAPVEAPVDDDDEPPF